MALGFWPLVLMNVREIQMDREFAEKDINLKLYGRTVYIVTQVFIKNLLYCRYESVSMNILLFFAVHFKFRTQFIHLVGLFVASA